MMSMFITLSTLFLICIPNESTQEEARPGNFSVLLKKADEPVGGHVLGAKSCGGPAEFVDFRIETCNPSAPCKIKATGTEIISAEMDFVPVIDMKQLRLLVNITLPDKEPFTAHNGPIDDSSVQKGAKHTLRVTAKTVKRIQPTKLQLKYMLYNVDDDSLRLCMEAEIISGP